MVTNILLSCAFFIGLAISLKIIQNERRKKKILELLNPTVSKDVMQQLQHLKHHHEAEMVLKKESSFLNYFRKVDSSMPLKLLMMAIACAVIFIANSVLSLEMARNTLLTVCVLVLLAALLLPSKLRGMLVARRVNKLSTEIPWLIDLLAICAQCGMSLEGAFTFISQKMTGINPDFTPFLERLVKRMEVSGLEEALKRFLIELPSQENRMLCASLQQSIQYGSSVYEQLMTLSREIREYQLLILEEKIGSLSAKMSVPLILFFMFPVVIIVAAPGIMRIFGDA